MSALFYKAAGAILAPFRYAEREVKHMKEVAIEDLQALLANAIKITVIAVVFTMFLLFISIMVATAVNDASGSIFLGWAIVAGFYLLVALALYIWKEATDHKKKKPVGNIPRRMPVDS